MRAEACVDERVLHRLRVEHRHLAGRLLQREYFGRRVIRALLAERGVVPAAYARRQPQAPLLVEHRVMVIGSGIPELLIAPVRRGLHGLQARRMARPQRFGHLGIRDRHLEERDLVALRIEDRHVVGRVLRRTVERAVGIHGRVAPVRRDQIVQIALLGAPFPGRNHDVAFDTLRTLRLGEGQLALRDAIGPLAVVLVGRAAEVAGELHRHLLARLPGLDAPHPGLLRALELAERRLDRARRGLAELVAADAADVLHLLQPIDLRALLRNLGVSAEFARRRNLEHRVPVDRRVILRGRRVIRRRHRGEVERLARRGLHLARIDESIAAHPDAVAGFRQLGDEIAPFVIGDDDLRVLGREIRGLGDHPHAGFGPFRTGDHAADVGRADLLRMRGDGEECEQQPSEPHSSSRK